MPVRPTPSSNTLPDTLYLPALLIAAPASGQGKTTVTAGLAHLHSRQGRKVRIFKTGPDFLDPAILAAASGAPVHTIDLWMTGADDASTRLASAAREADLILVEGVMGLHDGSPSSADVARRFGLPVLSVIEAGAMAQTFGALAYGLANYGGAPLHMDVLANGVGSARHAEMLEASLPAGIRWAGALPEDPSVSLPERHLGLLGADELPDLAARLDRIADLLAPLPVARVPEAVALANAAAAIPPAPLLAGKTIAIARDAAFRFIYPANLETLREMGAQLSFFSPLADTCLPACDALWLPGGYPELHAAQLASNHAMRAALRDAHRAGLPILAECGGMMALFDTLVDKGGSAHAMMGLLPGTVLMQGRLAAIGHQAVKLPEGELRGHTFHYSKTESPLVPHSYATSPREDLPSTVRGEAVYRKGTLTASYVHLYFPSNPRAITAVLTGPAG